MVTTALCSSDNFIMASFNLRCSSERSASRTGLLVAVSSRNSLSFWMLAATSSPVREADLSELQRRLNEAMMKLSDEHRAVVTMFHIQGMPHAEISKILNVSEGTVRSRLFYANRQLQNYLDEFRKNPVT